jgi:hypothetical protein
MTPRDDRPCDRVRRLLPAALALAVLAFAVPACRPRPAVPPPDPVDPSTLSPDVRIEQSLWLQAGGRSFLGRGVVVKRGARLDLVVLAPTGNRLLTVRDDGGAVTSEARVAGLDRLDPRFLLADVRWAFFGGCPPGPDPAGDRPAGSAPVRSCTIGSARVVETGDPATGDLARRDVSWGGLSSRLDFLEWGGDGPDRHPVRVRLANDRLGYEWEVRVDAFTRLSAP